MREIDKLEFRLSQPGLRRLQKPCRRTPLPRLETELSWLASLRRRSHRKFRAGTIDLQTFGAFLECLASRSVVDTPFPKYWYGSAGSLYPVRAYVYAKPNGVEGLASAYYYHDPTAHTLVMMSDTPALEPERFGQNRDIFSRGSFALFLAAHMHAIAPVYGDAALRFAYIEAGLMTQLLELRAAELRVGTCQLGGGELTIVRPALALEDDDVIAHILVGGLSAE